MACGNNHVSRAFLASPPTPVTQKIEDASRVEAGPAVSNLPPIEDTRRDLYVTEDGRVTDTAASGDKDRHVHVVYHYQPEGAGGSTEPTGMVMVQVTDRTIDKQFGELHGIDRGRRGTVRGHHESTLFLRTPSPEQLNRAVEDAVGILEQRRGH